MFGRSTFLYFTVWALSACGGSGGSSSTFTEAVTPTRLSTAGLDFEISRDPTTGMITLDPDPSVSGEILFTRDTTSDIPGFEGFSTQNSQSRLLRGGSETSVVAIIQTAPDLQEEFIGSIASRNIEANVPIEGSGRYTGEYGAFLAGEGLETFGSTISGRVSVDVDFTTGNVTGNIVNRQTVEGTNLTDLELTAGFPLAVGSFVGNVETAVDVEIPAVGTYNILVSGEQGDELVGTTTLDHIFPATGALGQQTIREHGGFIAPRD